MKTGLEERKKCVRKKRSFLKCQMIYAEDAYARLIADKSPKRGRGKEEGLIFSSFFPLLRISSFPFPSVSFISRRSAFREVREWALEGKCSVYVNLFLLPRIGSDWHIAYWTHLRVIFALDLDFKESDPHHLCIEIIFKVASSSPWFYSLRRTANFEIVFPVWNKSQPSSVHKRIEGENWMEKKHSIIFFLVLGGLFVSALTRDDVKGWWHGQFELNTPADEKWKKSEARKAPLLHVTRRWRKCENCFQSRFVLFKILPSGDINRPESPAFARQGVMRNHPSFIVDEWEPGNWFHWMSFAIGGPIQRKQ